MAVRSRCGKRANRNAADTRRDVDRLVRTVSDAEPNPPTVGELVARGFSREIIDATVRSGELVRVSAEILFDMRLALYRHLQRLSPRFYARTRLGDIVSRINNDIGEIQRVAAENPHWRGIYETDI